MTIQELINIMENRIINLEETRKNAFASGLIDQVNSLDNDLISTRATLASLYNSINPTNNA